MEKYNSQTAFHYKAFRPPIHRQILNRTLGPSIFTRALDVGCGTGQSTIALTYFCNQVVGYDSNGPMLKQAHPHPRVHYSSDLDFNFQFELLSFFGSINYINKLKFSQLLNLLTPKGTLICCDFDLQYPSPIRSLLKGSKRGNYDPAKDLSSYEIRALQEIHRGSTKLTFQASVKETAHLLLGDSYFFSFFQKYDQSEDPIDGLIATLNNYFSKDEIEHEVIAYWTKYSR